MNIDPNLLVGGTLTGKNARNLYLSAKRLAAEGRYGPACSLLILAAEEAVKAVDRVFLGFGIDMDPNTLPAKRQNHKYRHGAARLAMAIAWYTQRYEPMPEMSAEWRDRLEPALRDLIRDWNREQLPTEVQQTWDWWRQANALKMRGFYVDQSNDKWLAPDTLSEADYLNTIRHVKPFVSVRLLIRALEKYDWIKTMEAEIKRFEDPNVVLDFASKLTDESGANSDS